MNLIDAIGWPQVTQVNAEDVEGRLVELMLVPTDDKGLARSVNGDFTLGAKEAKAVIAAFEAHGVNIPIDYEHSSLEEFRKTDSGSPAAGWITKLVYKAGSGLFGLVEWTTRARKMILAKEYKYLSPVVQMDKESRRVFRLASAGLVNTPAMVGMQAVAAKESEMAKKKEIQANQEPTQGDGEGGAGDPVDDIMVTIGLICGELGVTPEGTPGAILKAVYEKIKGGGGEGDEEGPAAEEASKARVALGLPADAKTEVVTAKLAELTGHVGYVPAKEYTALKGRLETIEQANAARAAADLVAEYVEAGKLNPDDADQMKWANEQAKMDATAFKTLMSHAPDIRPPQGTSTAPKGVSGGNRATIIATAAREFDTQDPAYQQLANKRELIDNALVTSNHKVLTDDEAETFGV